MSNKECGEVCRCIASGRPGCTISEKVGRQERYLAAKEFLAKSLREDPTVRPGFSVWDMLPEGFDVSGLTIDAGDAAHLRAREAHAKAEESNDPIAAAQREYLERLAPKPQLNERAKAFVQGYNPDDQYEAMLRRVGGR